ncbi:MAG: hypothetical protein JW841_06945 [Deltaproteobacteria bacterium]|nr:hypothetical protein [Deltaproteobacteria bacterium]
MFIFVSSANGQNLDGEIQDLTWVGFQQFQDASRVFVRTSDKAHYKVDSSRDNLVILILENAKVPLFNNTRPLLTQHFAGPITSIVAKPIEGASPSVNIEIRLLRKVTFNVSQTDTIVALDFSR